MTTAVMPRASVLTELLAYTAPILYGVRCWFAATRRDPAHLELDPIG